MRPIPDHKMGVSEIFSEMGVIEGKLKWLRTLNYERGTNNSCPKNEFEAKIKQPSFRARAVRILSSR